MERLKLGISACLLGKKVRYDGRDAYDSYLIDLFSPYFQLVPICPETEAGLGIPREPMMLVDNKNSPRLVVIKTGNDVTKKIIAWTQRKLKEKEMEHLGGLILKSKSPSCGLKKVKLFKGKPPPSREGKGLFAQSFQEKFPFIPVEEDTELQQTQQRENFINRIFILYEWRRFLQKGKDIKFLVDFHSRFKSSLLAQSQKYYYQMEKLVKQAQHFPLEEIIKQYSQLLVKALSLKATNKKHSYTLNYLLAFLKKSLQPEEKKELLDVISSYQKGEIPLVIPITLINHYAQKYNQPYLQQQYYLHPHPLQLKLLNHA